MNPFHCPECCSLLGYFASAAVAIATYAGKCFWCRKPLAAPDLKATHAEALQARAARVTAPTPPAP